MKILVVDDEPDICEILQYNLEVEGFGVVTANSAEEAQRLALSEFSMILLDVMMGEMSGFQFARLLKENPETEHIPIIFITALDGEDDTVKGLNLGADDYIAKPLSIKEVKARVRAVLRRYSSNESHNRIGETPESILEYESLSINEMSKTAVLDGEQLILTKLEFELLSLFVQSPNKVFSREELMRRCWPQDVYVLDRTVDVNITRLRKKLGNYGNRLKTRVGYGYFLEK